jgi:hypothetical protein
MWHLAGGGQAVGAAIDLFAGAAACRSVAPRLCLLKRIKCSFLTSKIATQLGHTGNSKDAVK